MINFPLFLFLYLIYHNNLISRSLYNRLQFWEARVYSIWLYGRSLNFIPLKFCHLVHLASNAIYLKLRMEYIFLFFLLFLNSIISRILRAVYHIMKYRQPCKPPTYYIFFLFPLKHRGISVFICFSRQTALVPLGLSSRCTRWIPS